MEKNQPLCGRCAGDKRLHRLTYNSNMKLDFAPGFPSYFEIEAFACHSCPTPSAPTPGEDWAVEFDKMMGKGDNELQGHHTGCRYRTGYNEELKAFIRNILSSRESKAREEGRKEGYEVGYTKAQIYLKADDEIIGAEPCGGGCNGYKRAGASHCAFIGCGSRPDSQTNPKKEL